MNVPHIAMSYFFEIFSSQEKKKRFRLKSVCATSNSSGSTKKKVIEQTFDNFVSVLFSDGMCTPMDWRNEQKRVVFVLAPAKQKRKFWTCCWNLKTSNFVFSTFNYAFVLPLVWFVVSLSYSLWRWPDGRKLRQTF